MRQWRAPEIVNERLQMLVNLLPKRGEAVGVEVRGRVCIPQELPAAVGTPADGPDALQFLANRSHARIAAEAADQRG